MTDQTSNRGPNKGTLMPGTDLVEKVYNDTRLPSGVEAIESSNGEPRCRHWDPDLARCLQLRLAPLR